MKNGAPIRVYFTCRICGLPYRATKEPHPQRQFGSLSCEKCGETVIEWTGFYNLVDWQVIKLRRAPRG